MKSFRQYLEEKAPPGKKAEEWIKANKAEFKDRYGDEWESVLYGRAWELFGDSIETVDVGFEDAIKEIFDKMMNEESTAASTGTGGVAMPDSRPLGRKSKFMGHPCVEVDDETFSQCIRGKTPFKRWAKYVGDDELRNEMRKMYQKHKRMLIKNSRTGGMVFVK